VGRYRFTRAEEARYPVALLCRVLGVARSGFYAWARRGVSARATAERALAAQLAQIHEEGRRAGGLAGRHRRRRTRTTVADPAQPPAPNLVARAFAAPAPDRPWPGDLTYVAAWAGGLYLAALLDAHSRRVVGWAMADHLRTELALGSRRPGPRLVHHPDRGCQYTAAAYRAVLTGQRVAVSMSRAGDCYDNAMAESFSATLQAELAAARPWPTRAAARQAIFAWSGVFHTRPRLHSALGYRTPVAFELAPAGEAQAA
jgi:transposase InsO family protein